MKPQDIVFVLILGTLVYLKKPVYLVTAGILCLLFSIPLFHFWIFFTAQRLVMYAAGFFLAAIVLLGFKMRK